MTIDIYKNEAKLVKELTDYFENKNKYSLNEVMKNELLDSTFLIKGKKAFKKTIKIGD